MDFIPFPPLLWQVDERRKNVIIECLWLLRHPQSDALHLRSSSVQLLPKNGKISLVQVIEVTVKATNSY